ncbi:MULTISPECIES: sensor domain-containing diguanylate cyclase [Gammaproteobacteria]|uniref:GGDEF domain-containing protein n=1 Tax=Gammaproteobacteria TaxID=1236 RepID=UPI000DD02178|nr:MULTISPECIES: sensor domain-containing diguanylate cyclase [Gammaproteobacteria]RTE86612.1 sensor domain-containing diguanylate cyclase [Aliidiomarina sp. B3213]TCZ90833.1 sensor domain-containing diguanylate cyclase [Lysobacter sp. N42]
MTNRDFEQLAQDNHLILEGGNVGTWVWNVQTGETRFNEAWANIIGYTLSEISPVSIETWMSFAHEEDLELSNQKLQEHFTGKTEQYVCEARMRHKQGHLVKVLDKGKVFTWDKDGNPEWMYGIHVDITEQWEKEKEIERLKQKLELFTDNLPGFVYQYKIDSQGNASFPFASAKVEEIYGCKPEQIIEDASIVMDVLSPKDRHRVENSISKSMQYSQDWNASYRVNHPQKGEIWVEGKSTPQKMEDGSVIWHGYLHDVTEEMRQREQLKLMSAVFSATNQSVMIADSSARITDVNKAFEHLTGYSKEEVVGNNPSMLSSGRQPKSFYQAMWAEITQTGHWKGELWNRKKSGEAFPQLLTIDALMGEDGEITHYIGVSNDISELIAKQDKLEGLVHEDPLTGLLNRRALDRELEELISSEAYREDKEHLSAVLYFDLDNFKSLNDHVGHAAGDDFLVELAVLLKSELRESDVLSRVGGDEFVAVINGVKSKTFIDEIVKRFEDATQKLAKQYKSPKPVGVSIGVAYYPVDAKTSKALLELADQRMYAIKKAHKTELTE